MATENTCEQCPVRWLAINIRSQGKDTADIIRAMGGDETLAQSIIARKELEAKEMESRGCPWWWSFTEKQGNMHRDTWDCGVRHHIKLILDQGSLVEEAMQTAQSSRNEVERFTQEVEKVNTNLSRNNQLVDYLGRAIVTTLVSTGLDLGSLYLRPDQLPPGAAIHPVQPRALGQDQDQDQDQDDGGLVLDAGGSGLA